LDEMKSNGSDYELGNVQRYFSDMKNYRKGLQPQPQELQPSPLG